MLKKKKQFLAMIRLKAWLPVFTIINNCQKSHTLALKIGLLVELLLIKFTSVPIYMYTYVYNLIAGLKCDNNIYSW